MPRRWLTPAGVHDLLLAGRHGNRGISMCRVRMQIVGRWWAAGLLVQAAFGQVTATDLSTRTFVAASVKRDPPQTLAADVIREDAGRIYYSRIPLRRLISRAYAVKDYQIEWKSEGRPEFFEIAATLPDGSTKKQIPEMLRALLADRFKLVSHYEPRDVPVFELVRGNAAFKPKRIIPPDGAQSNGCTVVVADDDYHARALTVATLASCLMVAGRPVFDATGIEGTFDIDIEFSGASAKSSPASDDVNGVSSGEAPSISTALHNIGLKLVSGHRSLPQLVIDRLNSIPTDNWL